MENILLLLNECFKFYITSLITGSDLGIEPLVSYYSWGIGSRVYILQRLNPPRYIGSNPDQTDLV